MIFSKQEIRGEGGEMYSLGSKLGAIRTGEGNCRFCVWAPQVQKVEIQIVSPGEHWIALQNDGGYHQGWVKDIRPGALYFCHLDGEKRRPDPASRFQPDGVHGPSQVIGSNFPWEDQAWAGLPLEDFIIYELHVGSFTQEGTFDAILPRLEELKHLGVTALEIMPVAQFPGSRNWGYDGVYPYAVQDSYGGPLGLKRLVNACHLQGMAVILDVVYNHLGPEGNYLRDFGPYFTDRYKTPWGEAVNFDGPGSDGVRRFFIENALYWTGEFHMDGLRLDALHAICDASAYPFLQELGEAVHRQAKENGCQVHLFAECDLNDTRPVRPPEMGGYGLDALWNDDFHHALHTVLTGEQGGYYRDFGKVRDLARGFRDGFVFDGRYSSCRDRTHGTSSRHIPAHRFVVFAQNHDQVGNRMLGERLTSLVPWEGLRTAAGAVLLSPCLPLLFMGEEYGETAPFLYFVSHSDPALVEAVRRGRKEEFKAFGWKGEVPDPQSEETFLRSKLNPAVRRQGPHRLLLEFYRELIRLRRTLPPLSNLAKDRLEAASFEEEKALWIRRWEGREEIFLAFNLGESPNRVSFSVPPGDWKKELDSEDERWGGKGSLNPDRIHSPGKVPLPLHPRSFILYRRKEER